MKIDQAEIHAAVIECLNEAVAINPAAVEQALLSAIVPYPPFLAHRNSPMAAHYPGIDQLAPGQFSGLSAINALLDKLGIDPIVPVRDTTTLKLTGFVDQPKVSTVTSYISESRVDEAVMPILEDGWQRTVNDSSQVDSYHYHEQTQELDVRFKRGGVYTYQGVPQDVALAFGAAASPGSYLNTSIKKTYPFVKRDGQEAV